MPVSVSITVSVATVALFARAWIEIPNFKFNIVDVSVALFARAWIEIFTNFLFVFKFYVALFARAWIEICYHHIGNFSCRRSPSLRGRGLKCQRRYRPCGICWSPSLRGRGLKSNVGINNIPTVYVALFARAWIEIYLYSFDVPKLLCRPLCEGVD